MVETKQQTVKEWLEGLANTDTSTDKDSRMMENLLHKVGFPSAKVVLGIVYPEGYGKPVSIHSMAQVLLHVGDK